MGGDLRTGPEGAAPTFMVRALRDPDGANLDRIQIIKGWLDADGKTRERVSFMRFARYGLPITLAQLTLGALYVFALGLFLV